MTAAVGLTLLLGGGTAGFALAAGDGPNRGGAVPTAEDGHERPDRGGPAGARGDLDG